MKRTLFFILIVCFSVHARYVWVSALASTASDRTHGLTYDDPIVIDTVEVAVTAATDTIFVLSDGLHVAHGNINLSAIVGDVSTQKVKLLGVKAATAKAGADVDSSDFVWKDSVNWSHIDMQGYTFVTGDGWDIRFFSFTGSLADSGLGVLTCGKNTEVRYCKFVNDTGTTNSKAAIYLAAGSDIGYCYISGGNVNGLRATGTAISDCYFYNTYNSTNGSAIDIIGTGCRLNRTDFDHCYNAINAGRYQFTAENCNFNYQYRVVTAIYAANCKLKNCAIDSTQDTALVWSTPRRVLLEGIHWGSENAAEMSGVLNETGIDKNYFTTRGSPLWVNPNIGNFNTPSNSPLVNTGVTR